MMIQSVACHTPSHHVIITQQENMDHVDQVSQPHPAKEHAPIPKEPIQMTNGWVTQPTQFHQMFKKFKLNS